VIQIFKNTKQRFKILKFCQQLFSTSVFVPFIMLTTAPAFFVKKNNNDFKKIKICRGILHDRKNTEKDDIKNQFQQFALIHKKRADS
jgi:hypothetical protein